MEEREFGIALIAAPGDRAETIARAVVQSRKAACAQVTSEVTSVGAIRELLKELHPYEVPELVFGLPCMALRSHV